MGRIIDINAPAEAEIVEIRWTTEAMASDDTYNLIPRRGGKVTIKDGFAREILDEDANLCENAVEAERLIKGLQKAIDLGWFNK